MGFNKAKAVRTAEKFLAQGKIANAITEYQRIVAEDAHDYNVLNMLGDLYVRTGKAGDATACFQRVAEHYRKQGFTLKAIAIYKKILKHQPSSLETMHTLAELYTGQGLMVEARAQYLQVADIFTQHGETRRALDTLLKISDLDPTNGEVRMRVADSYARENFAPEAAEAYTDAGERFLDKGKPERALEAFNRALSLKEQNLRALQGFVFAHTALESADEAAEVLEELVTENRPADETTYTHELRQLLLRSYLGAENPIAAERTLHALITAHDNTSSDPANVRQFLLVARLYMRVGDTDSGVRALGHAVEPLLTEREDASLLEVLNEALARNPEHLEALKYSARIYTWQHDETLLRQTLERLIEAARDQANDDEERRAIEQLLSFTTPEPCYTERLRELGSHFIVDFNDEQRTETSADPAPDAPPASANEIPTFESFMFEYHANHDSTSDVHQVSDTNQPSHLNQSAAPTVNVNEFEFVGNDNRNVHTETPTAPPKVGLSDASETSAAAFDESASFADLNDETASDEKINDVPGVDEHGFDVTLDNLKVAAPDCSAALKQELESVDFYIEQGYADVARDTLDLLERQHGAHAEIAACRAQLEVRFAAPNTQKTLDAKYDLHVEPSADEPAAKVSATDLSMYDLSFDAPATGETFAHTETSNASSFAADTATPDIGLSVQGDHPQDSQLSYFNEAHETFASSETADTAASDVGIASARTEVANFEVTSEPASSTAALFAGDHAPDEGLAAIFDEFKTAVEDSEPVSTADYETHYNLGIAYQEMELHDEAIEEFQKAANLAAADDGTPRYLQCCNMLGHCFAAKGMYSLAAMWFRKGLDTPKHTEDEYQALRFELATVLEKMGDLNAAKDTFMQVYGIDVSYRGVAERLRDLQSRATVLTSQ